MTDDIGGGKAHGGLLGGDAVRRLDHLVSPMPQVERAYIVRSSALSSTSRTRVRVGSTSGSVAVIMGCSRRTGLHRLLHLQAMLLDLAVQGLPIDTQLMGGLLLVALRALEAPGRWPCARAPRARPGGSVLGRPAGRGRRRRLRSRWAGGRRSLAPMVSPAATSTPRSRIVCSSSRTLPGQSWESSASYASAASSMPSRPCRIGILAEKVIAQERDVVASLPQGRHPDGDGVDPEVQILPQAALRQRGLEVDVGRRDQTKIDWLGLVSPRWADTPGSAGVRRSRVCRSTGISPISSSSSDPPLAALSRPVRSVLAPVKAPFL